jgi:hypothetical protein
VALIGARRQRFGSIARSLTGELKRRKLALYLKLEFTFAQLYDRAKIVDERFTFPPINESWYFKVADIEIKEPLELEEAWAYLDIFPSTTIAEIRSVRNSLRGLQAICDRLGDQLLEIKPDVENPIGNEISGCASEIWMACEIVNAELNPADRKISTCDSAQRPDDPNLCTGRNKRQQNHSAHRRGGHDVRPLAGTLPRRYYTVFQPIGDRFCAPRGGATPNDGKPSAMTHAGN